jgi:hypothetical protein
MWVKCTFLSMVIGDLMGRLIGIARREEKRAPMETLEQAEVSDQTGVARDSRGKPGDRTVTIISAPGYSLDNPARQPPGGRHRSAEVCRPDH